VFRRDLARRDHHPSQAAGTRPNRAAVSAPVRKPPGSRRMRPTE